MKQLIFEFRSLAIFAAGRHFIHRK